MSSFLVPDSNSGEPNLETHKVLSIHTWAQSMHLLQAALP